MLKLLQIPIFWHLICAEAKLIQINISKIILFDLLILLFIVDNIHDEDNKNRNKIEIEKKIVGINSVAIPDVLYKWGQTDKISLDGSIMEQKSELIF